MQWVKNFWKSTKNAIRRLFRNPFGNPFSTALVLVFGGVVAIIVGLCVVPLALFGLIFDKFFKKRKGE